MTFVLSVWKQGEEESTPGGSCGLIHPPEIYREG